MVTMLAALTQSEPSGTLGGSALASWTPFWGLVGVFAAINVALFVVGRPSERPWPLLRPLSRIPNGIERLTRIPGWAGVSIGMALYGLLVAGQGFYSDVAWHIALGRDDELLTAPHSGILLGLVMILGGAVLGTVVATFERVDGIRVGSLRIPPSLLPLWALGLGAVAGFPLDEIWHREYGVDVTMWSPTHMLMILGATFTGLAAWLILAEAGVRATDGPWGRGAHLVCGWLTLQGLLAPQGEFTFGVPQFNLLFSPILVCLAAGMGLVALRIVHGRWWMLGLVVVNFAIQATGFLDFGGDDSPVETRFGTTFLASAIVVEVLARLLGTEDRTRFALLSGLGIGTIGLAAEHVWNTDAWQPWSGALYPEALVLGVVAAVGAAVLGTAFARALERDRAGRALPASLVIAAGAACLVVLALPMRRTTGDVVAEVHLEPVGTAGATAHVIATLTPADAADDASWFQASAWQGGGLELAEMEPTGVPGQFRSDQAIPVTGHWKSLLRLHRGNDMMAVPLYLPADPDIDEPEIPAIDRTMAFGSEREYLLRETHSGSGWMSPVVHGFLASVAAIWALAFVVAVRRLAPPAGGPPSAGASARRRLRPGERRSVEVAAG
jgi:hypothetical protein